MGNLAEENTLTLLKKYEDQDRTSSMLWETCFLAKELINWKTRTDNGKVENLDFKQLIFKTNDPAPPYSIYSADCNSDHKDVPFLEGILIDRENKYDLFERYRALFTLRELNTKESIIAICQTLVQENMDKCGALLKHEVAYVLAQMEDLNEHAVPFLIDSVLNDGESPIVRHEALIAVGEMIDEQGKLEHLLKHKDEIVSESAEVAIRNIQNRLAEQEFIQNMKSD